MGLNKPSLNLQKRILGAGLEIKVQNGSSLVAPYSRELGSVCSRSPTMIEKTYTSTLQRDQYQNQRADGSNRGGHAIQS